MLARLSRQAWLWPACWRLYPLRDALRQEIPEIELPPEPACAGTSGAGCTAPPRDAREEDSMSASRLPVLRPHQLPDPPAWLAGRDTELGALDQMLAVPGHGQVTVVISGVPGVGKTALAAWWLHQHRRHFRDGQLHARLAGPHGLGETPSEALARWLRALGVAAISIPASQADRIRLWQSVTAGRRLALMVDDAPSKEAVTALLPGPGPAAVVVTSRQGPGRQSGGRFQAASAPPAEASRRDHVAGPPAWASAGGRQNGRDHRAGASMRRPASGAGLCRVAGRPQR